MSLNRRNFLKSSLLSTSGLILGNKALASSQTDFSRPIITRKLGKTGIELPVISMGVMNAENPNLLKVAYEKGIKHFDSAHIYQNGNNEKMCGTFLKDKPRDSFVIATKVIPPGLDFNTGQIGKEFTTKEYISMFDTSLERLQMDYVDIFYQHMVSNEEAVLREDISGTMKKIKDAGKAKFIGVSTHSNQVEVIRAVTKSGVYDVVLVGINFMLDNWKEIRDAMAEGAAAGIGFIAMKTLAGVYFDDKYHNPVNPVAALKWVLQDPNVCTCIPGFTLFEHIETDVEVMYDIILSPEEEQELNEDRKLTGLFCQGCRICTKQCPKGLPIPDIMRSYMYAYGYKDMGKARETLDLINIYANPCKGCNTCLVNCTKGFPVADRISKVTRLKEVPKEAIA